MERTPYEKTMDRALRLLSYKPRSVAEMRSRLLEKDWSDEETVNQVISRLEELGYLDDEQFATSYANSRLNVKPLGRTRLRQDLRRKKLSDEIVENALEEAFNAQSEERLIERAIDKHLRSKGAPKTRVDSKKLFDYLIRRGFSYELVLRKVRQVGKDVEVND